MKNKITALASLTLILAGSASAQVMILPGGRGNIYIGTPMTFPGPTSHIVITPRIHFPAPPLRPSIMLTAAPVPMAAALRVLPAAVSQPRLIAERENVALPFAVLHAQFAAPAKNDSAKSETNDELDGIFDGRKVSKDESGPVRSGSHVSLPEQDLESEIGAY